MITSAGTILKIGAAFLTQIERAARKLVPSAQQNDELVRQDEKPEADESEVPMTKEQIIAESGFDVWACAVAAFGDLPAFSFSQSKFAHTWAADSVANPVIAAVPKETVSKAVLMIEAKADAEMLEEWVCASFEPDIHAEMNERLQRVADECREEYQLSMPDFIHMIEQFERSVLNNIRVLRSVI